MRWLISLILICIFAPCIAQADSMRRTLEKINGKGVEKQVIDKLSNGYALDLIVVFDEDLLLARSNEELVRRGVPNDAAFPYEERLVRNRNLRAIGKKEAKSRLLPNEYEQLANYPNLPHILIRLRSLNALHKLTASPYVKAIYENTPLDIRPASVSSLGLIGQAPPVPSGWTGAGTSVAILDFGIYAGAQDIGTCLSPGYPIPNTINDTQIGKPGCRIAAADGVGGIWTETSSVGHGTNVAAIALGVAPGAKAVTYNIYGFSLGQILPANILSGINWVLQNKGRYNIVATNLSSGLAGYAYASHETCPNWGGGE